MVEDVVGELPKGFAASASTAIDLNQIGTSQSPQAIYGRIQKPKKAAGAHENENASWQLSEDSSEVEERIPNEEFRVIKKKQLKKDAVSREQDFGKLVLTSKQSEEKKIMQARPSVFLDLKIDRRMLEGKNSESSSSVPTRQLSRQLKKRMQPHQPALETVNSNNSGSNAQSFNSKNSEYSRSQSNSNSDDSVSVSSFSGIEIDRSEEEDPCPKI